MSIWGEQWECGCTWANSVMRSRCRNCGQPRGADAVVQTAEQLMEQFRTRAIDDDPLADIVDHASDRGYLLGYLQAWREWSASVDRRHVLAENSARLERRREAVEAQIEMLDTVMPQGFPQPPSGHQHTQPDSYAQPRTRPGPHGPPPVPTPQGQPAGFHSRIDSMTEIERDLTNALYKRRLP